MRHRTLCVKMSADELSFLLICIPTILPNIRISGRWILRSFPHFVGLGLLNLGIVNIFFFKFFQRDRL